MKLLEHAMKVMGKVCENRLRKLVSPLRSLPSAVGH